MRAEFSVANQSSIAVRVDRPRVDRASVPPVPVVAVPCIPRAASPVVDLRVRVVVQALVARVVVQVLVDRVRVVLVSVLDREWARRA